VVGDDSPLNTSPDSEAVAMEREAGVYVDPPAQRPNQPLPTAETLPNPAEKVRADEKKQE